MAYIISFILLFALILMYFRIADKYNIIDKPNHRSAHTEITLRGGGVIYPIAFLLFFITQSLNYSIAQSLDYGVFGLGLLTICTISFIDDIVDLSSKIRLIFHFISVTLLLYYLNLFSIVPLWGFPVIYILVIGILNAYNFMDGINGMSGLYSLVALASLLYINTDIFEFTHQDFIIYPLLASLVFLFFNFRKKAKCFMGDVGSMGIAFWIIALITLLIVETGHFKYILFLTVYGVEVIFTIIERLALKENIFEAHRRHLYQLFANEKKVSHLTISSVYAAVQLGINLFIINFEGNDVLSFFIVIGLSSAFYLFLKIKTKKELAKI